MNVKFFDVFPDLIKKEEKGELEKRHKHEIAFKSCEWTSYRGIGII
jgi:hypothetical protein